MSLLSEGQLTGFTLGFLLSGDFCTEGFRPVQIPPKYAAFGVTSLILGQDINTWIVDFLKHYFVQPFCDQVPGSMTIGLYI